MVNHPPLCDSVGISCTGLLYHSRSAKSSRVAKLHTAAWGPPLEASRRPELGTAPATPCLLTPNRSHEPSHRHGCRLVLHAVAEEEGGGRDGRKEVVEPRGEPCTARPRCCCPAHMLLVSLEATRRRGKAACARRPGCGEAAQRSMKVRSSEMGRERARKSAEGQERWNERVENIRLFFYFDFFEYLYFSL
jgi:hypothetical protein